ncbi:hypothetical protein EON64_03550 [archaeon]|nr:MAG: hypothetical protein EON64_03550 [archaeon]
MSKVVIEDKLMKTVPATSPSTPTTPTNQNSNNNLGNTPASPTIPPSSSIISPRTNASASFLKFADLIKCPASVSEQYAGASSTSSQKAGSDKAWCQNAVSNRGVRVGHSWGSLNKREKDEWEERHCNEYVQTGLQLTCNEKWGWKWLQNWKQNAHQIVSSDSNVKCFVDKIRTSTYCEVQ